ncbi:MAG: VCBS repeat-containing protein [Bacteroidota bacterium]
MSKIYRTPSILGLLAMLILSSCTQIGSSGDTVFQLLDPKDTGVNFNNYVVEREDFNIFNYMYFYNGGGVAAGDLNGDQLPDLYFTANMDNNKLYLNKGNMEFQDITEEAGVAGTFGWATGVAFADVNADGLLDIYVSHVGDYLKIKGRNLLYINQGTDPDGIPLFEESAAAYGLDIVGFCTQAAFFDYDLDNDLDLFILNHSIHQNGTFGKSSKRQETHPLSGDRLFRNDNGRFSEVTEESGIYSSVLGYGLGVTVADINLDGYPDLYIGNDFHENDYLYINNGDGTFRDALEEQIAHTSRFTMGTDVQDINNDGLPDIFSLDMLPEDPEILKASAAEDPYDIYQYKTRFGYAHQFSRNTLQLNNGNGTFSEIGRFSDVFASDWSWSTLLLDYDFDGHKDIFVSNGILRRPNDMDYINFVSSEEVQARLKADVIETEDLGLVQKMPEMKLHNYLFQGQEGTQFKDVSQEWGFEATSFSHGAAYADLDQDGDADLICNNTQGEAFIYENKTIQEGIENEVNYLKIRLEGEGDNPFGLGAKIYLTIDEKQQYQEFQTVRGYHSTVDYELFFGLGADPGVDELQIIWPDGKMQQLQAIPANQTLVLKAADADQEYVFGPSEELPLFTDVSDAVELNYQHEENKFVEFNREKLIPHMVSTGGPAIASGDINGDGLDDLFLGGAKRQKAELMLQTSSGDFQPSEQPWLEEDQLSEDVAADFFDADNDQDLDLIIAPGGNEFKGEHEARQVKLYLNDGTGQFTQAENFPAVFVTAGTIEIEDIDQDGDPDVFVGNRAVPLNYGRPASSYLLINDSGQFSDQTADKAEDLIEIGLVRDAAWADMDGDQQTDLVVVGEWMDIQIFYQADGQFTKRSNTQTALAGTSGFWNTCLPADVDQDGDMDLLLGNLGLNTKLKAYENQPIRLYLKDFDSNGSLDQILTYYLKGKEYIFYTKDELVGQLPELKKRYLSYWDFAGAGFREIFPNSAMENATVLEASEFRSGVLINQGNESYRFDPLPEQAQYAPVQSFQYADFDGDNTADVLAVGNFFDANIQMGRYDASFGTLFKGNGKGTFSTISGKETGLKINGQCRNINTVKTKDQELILVGRNNDQPVFLKNNKSQ